MTSQAEHKAMERLRKSARNNLLFAVTVGLGFFTTVAWAQDLTVAAFVNRAKIRLNDQFELKVELSGSDANSAEKPEPPAINSFASFVYAGSSTNFSLINGRASTTVTYSFHFIATKVGKFTIPAIAVSHKGTTVSSKPIGIQIVNAQSGAAGQSRPQSGQRQQPATGADLSELLFLRASADTRQVFQNQPVVVSYKIYFAAQVGNYGVKQLPNTVGFWAEEFDIPNPPKVYKEVINGRQFQVAEIKRTALFPQGPGGKELGEMQIECEVRLPRRRRRDVFDSFFDDPFSSFGRTVRQPVASRGLSIEVLPLPDAGKPLDFSGAVGQYALTVSVDKRSVKANEAISLKLTVSGTGNVKILQTPEVDFPAAFEVYDPKVTEKISRSGGSISGSKTFEYVLVPRRAGKQTVEPVSFSYFDPLSRSYKRASSRAVSFDVAESDEAFVGRSSGSSKEDVRFIGKDIRFIQTRLPEFRRAGSVLYRNWLFLVLLAVAPIMFLGAVGYRRHADKVSVDVAYARSRKANQMALKRLKKANRELSQGNSELFFSEVSSALMGFIGDKLNASAAGLITDDVAVMLKKNGVDEQVVAKYLDCLHACDYQRFSPGASNNGEMKTFFDAAKDALVSLEKAL